VTCAVSVVSSALVLIAYLKGLVFTQGGSLSRCQKQTR
jgi:hypothetical protein